MPALNLIQITSRLKPMVEYVNKQKENENFYQSLELNATVFLIIFFVIFAIRPTIITISSLIGEINAKEVQKTQLKSKINQIIKAQDLYSQVQGRYSLISQSLPDTPDYYGTANQLLKSSAESQLSFDEIKFIFSNEKSSFDHLKSFHLPISFSGDFTQLSQVLNTLINNRRLIKIPQAVFSINKDIGSTTAFSATPSGSLSGTFNSEVYYWFANNEKK